MFLKHYGYGEFLKLATKYRTLRSYSEGWAGDTFDGVSLKATRGDANLVAKAEDMLQHIQTPISAGVAWQSSQYGAYPMVGDFLAGAVDCMRARVRTEDEKQPITIYANLTVSAGFSVDEVMKRGMAILALVMQLQVSRPVELKLVLSWSNPDRVFVINVDSRPISIAHAANMLANPAFFRIFGHLVMFGEQKATGCSILNDGAVRRYLDLTEHDLYVGSLVWGSEILSDPIKWVNDQVMRFEGGNEDED